MSQNHSKNFGGLTNSSKKTNEVNSKDDEIVNSAHTIAEQLDDIFKDKEVNTNDLSKRKDVVNKVVLRAFKKFIVSRLKTNNRRRRNKNMVSLVQLKQEIIDRAELINLIDYSNPELSSPEYIDLVCWLSVAKNTKETKNLVDPSNESIAAIQVVLTQYSHSKLEKVFEDLHIKKVFEYFLNHGKQEVLNSLPNGKRDLYEETMEELRTNMDI